MTGTCKHLANEHDSFAESQDRPMNRDSVPVLVFKASGACGLRRQSCIINLLSPPLVPLFPHFAAASVTRLTSKL